MEFPFLQPVSLLLVLSLCISERSPDLPPLHLCIRELQTTVRLPLCLFPRRLKLHRTLSLHITLYSTQMSRWSSFDSFDLLNNQRFRYIETSLFLDLLPLLLDEPLLLMQYSAKLVISAEHNFTLYGPIA